MFFKKTSAVSNIVCFLGNPGKKYEETRHNVGFKVGEIFCRKYNITPNRLKFDALTGTGKFNEKTLLVMLPQTFMNLSGTALHKAMTFYKIPPERCIIVFDDVSLPVGKIRIRRDGSHGGHNGMRSIIEQCGSDGFPRIKIGVGGKTHPDMDLADHVLGKFKSDERVLLGESLQNAADALSVILTDGADAAMAKFN